MQKSRFRPPQQQMMTHRKTILFPQLHNQNTRSVKTVSVSTLSAGIRSTALRRNRVRPSPRETQSGVLKRKNQYKNGVASRIAAGNAHERPACGARAACQQRRTHHRKESESGKLPRGVLVRHTLRHEGELVGRALQDRSRRPPRCDRCSLAGRWSPLIGKTAGSKIRGRANRAPLGRRPLN